ncbi:MAG TPA: assimilatory sulfite reductase (NADPH) flavoprotein subunit [Dokdonella sp.]|nr:assimilatory sulfite reductase (NADPH) flavoprotein subunit [Dokdonella sp.]
MSAVPPLPVSPLPEEKSAEVLRLLEGLEAHALWWLSGYAAALARHGSTAQRPATPAREAPAPALLTIVYGSQTGNAKRLAERLARDADAAGLAARLFSAGAYPRRELEAERMLVVVISTHGDGEPPDDARGLVDFLCGKRAPRLADLRYAVLALGDSSYPQFCAIGRRVDARLAELGAARLLDTGEADVDVESVANPWLARLLELAREASAAVAVRSATVTPLRVTAPTARAGEWSRARPFAAGLLANQRIVARDCVRDVRHVELSLAGSGLAYEPGDALGVWPLNPPALVAAVLDATGLDGDALVRNDGRSLALREWLARERELTRLARPFVAAHAARARNDDLGHLLAPGRHDALAAWLASRQPIDLLREYPAAWAADEFVAALRPLAPRSYSIASSRKAVGDEAHLTIGVVAYEAFGRRHVGAASHFLAQADDDLRVPVYVEANERFRLPSDPSRDIIMVGPGTGIAPFRGFLQERREIGASGRNWLLFGNRHFRSEFLYQTEWQDALRDGSLHRLDLAWSRDGARSYVQDRLREHGRDLYAWLDAGAQLYVCGDATRMAKDVHAALLDVFVEHGGVDRERAEERLLQLVEEGRYARDVY